MDTSIKRECQTRQESTLWDFGQNLGPSNQDKTTISIQWKLILNSLRPALEAKLRGPLISRFEPDFFKIGSTLNNLTALNQREVEVYLTLNDQPVTFDPETRWATFDRGTVTEVALYEMLQALKDAVTTAKTRLPFNCTIQYNPQRHGVVHLIVNSRDITFRVIVALRAVHGGYLLFWNDEYQGENDQKVYDGPFLVTWLNYWDSLRIFDEGAPGLLDMIKIWKILIRHWNNNSKTYIPLSVSESLVWNEIQMDITSWNSLSFDALFSKLRASFINAVQNRLLHAIANQQWNLLSHLSHSQVQPLLTLEQKIPPYSDLLKFLTSICQEKGNMIWWVDFSLQQKAIRRFLLYRELAYFASALDLSEEEMKPIEMLPKTIAQRITDRYDPSLPLDITLQPTKLGTGTELDAYLIFNSALPVAFYTTNEISFDGISASKQSVAELIITSHDALETIAKEDGWQVIPAQKKGIEHARLKSPSGILVTVIPALKTQDNNLILFYHQPEGQLSYVPWKLFDLSQTEYGSQGIQVIRLLKTLTRSLCSTSDNNNNTQCPNISPAVVEQLALNLCNTSQSIVEWERPKVRKLFNTVVKLLIGAISESLKVPCFGNAKWWIQLLDSTGQVTQWARNLLKLSDSELVEQAEKALLQQMQKSEQSEPSWLNWCCTDYVGDEPVAMSRLQSVKLRATTLKGSATRKEIIQSFIQWIDRAQLPDDAPIERMLEGIIDPKQMTPDLIPHFINHSKSLETILCPNVEIQRHRRLGEGSFSVCYECTVDGQQAAVKAFKLDREDPTILEKDKNETRFYREATMLWLFHHDNIIKAIGYTECNIDGEVRKGLVMELMDCTLHAWIYAETNVTHNQCLKFSKEIASALAYLHQMTTAHRDLKLSNILVKRDTAKLADVGEAKIDFDNTNTFTRTGAAGHFSPEEVRKFLHVGNPPERLTLKTDVWKLGLVLLKLWANRNLVVATSGFPQVDYIQTEKLPEEFSPDKYNIPQAIKDIIHRCLALDPKDRPSAAEVEKMLCVIQL